jgi:transcriptional regulator with GAF, ATPase, and Fis domain
MYRSAEREIMSTAPQIAFDEAAEFESPELFCKHLQLVTALTAQASGNADLCALIEGLVDSISRAIRCDCAYIALLDPEDSLTFREFALQYLNRNRRVQQLPVISTEEGQRLLRVVELGQSVTFVGPESESHSIAGLTGFKAQCHFHWLPRTADWAS